MNMKEMVLSLNKEYCERFAREDTGDINDLLLTIITKFQMFEPCKYLSEDDEWLNVVILSIENPEVSQAMTIRKSEITTCGIFNIEDMDVDFSPQKGSEDLYQ